MHHDDDGPRKLERPMRDGLGRAKTFAGLRDEAKIPEAQLRARCEHLEAGLKVIAEGNVSRSNPGPGALFEATKAFAQSTLDEAPEAK